MLVNLFFYWMP